jgi:Ca-activated chloride channel homolog
MNSHQILIDRTLVTWKILSNGSWIPSNMQVHHMQVHRLLAQTISFRLVSSLTILSVCSALALAQSLEDVHVVPRDSVSNAPAADVIPIEKLPTMDASKPLKVDVDVVLVPVTVTDAMSHPVNTLKKQDFALYEEDKPQEIRYFSTEDAPISVAVLLDVSKSMTDKIDTERAAIVEFFKNANPLDEYFAITFSDRPRLLTRPTQSIDDIERKLLAAEPGGPTAMLDAIHLAESELRNARYKRRAIVIISDGGDNASHYTLRETRNLVQESDVEIFAIGLFDTFFFNTIEEKLGKKWLSEITDLTGGRTITVDNRVKVPEAAATISGELRTQYVLGYRPTNRSASHWRKIKVRVTAFATHPPLQAYYKKGYSASDR